MKLLVTGLGNPGKKYQQTRHNSGFIILDEFAREDDLSWKKLKQSKSLYTTKGDLIYLKPQTFMNLSGEAVGQALAYFKLEPTQLCVIHDDADLEKLQYKVQFGKGGAGHNGVEDIISHLGSNEFWRVRIGIGRSEERSFELEDWVLQKFPEEDLHELQKLALSLKKELENIKSTPRL